ncbi:hypothetical protein [Streptomyces sp. NPDC001774]
MPNSGGGSRKIGTGQYVGATKWAYGKYSFAVQGGAQGVVTLTGDTIPSGAIILDSLLIVDTAVTSGGSATVSIGTEGAADIRAAATAATAPTLSATGAKRSAIMDADSAPIVTTAARAITATIGVADLTAGVFRVAVAYVEVV